MPALPPITLVIARFEDLLARGLRSVIESDPSIEIVADDVDHDRIGVVLRAHRPRVLILDADALLKLTEVRELSCQHPDTRLVLLTSHPTTAESAQLLAFGASACLGRDTQARDVLSGIHLAARGLQLVPRGSRDSDTGSPPGLQPLTRREADVLPLLQQGNSNAHIAARLHVGVETVRTHASNIYRKLGISSRYELAARPPRTPLDAPVGDPLARRLRSGISRTRPEAAPDADHVPGSRNVATRRLPPG